MFLKELQTRLRNQTPLSSDWHSTLREYATELIRVTAPLRREIELRNERYDLGFNYSLGEYSLRAE